MGYKLNYMIRLIDSPVVMIFPDGSSKGFADGEEAIVKSFDKRYDVRSIKANENKVVIELVENDGNPKAFDEISNKDLY